MNNNNSKRVVLVYADKGSSIIYPQGLLYVAAMLRSRGYSPYILDTRVDKPRSDHFEGAIAVGISSMTGYQIGESIKVCKLARSVSNTIKIIWGGIHPTLLPEQTLANEYVDVVVRGEGEITFCEIVDSILHGSGDYSGIKGITYKDRNGYIKTEPDRDPIDLSIIPRLPYDLLKINKYYKTTDYFPYQVTRGCPFKCTFCYNQGVYSKWRYPSEERVIDELLDVNNRYGLDKGVHFLDDNLLVKPDYALRLFERKMRSNLAFEWNGSTTIKGMLQYSLDDLGVLKRSGLKYLRFGAESGSPKIIKSIRKNFQHDDAYAVLEKLKHHGIEAVFSFMVGFPRENAEDRIMTYDFIDELRRRYDKFSVKTIWRLVPYPGTEVYDEAVKLGYNVPQTLEEWSGYGFTNMPRLPWLSNKDFSELMVVNSITRYPFQESPLKMWKSSLRSLSQLLLHLSSYLRWKNRWFKYGVEWKIRSFVYQWKYGKGTI